MKKLLLILLILFLANISFGEESCKFKLYKTTMGEICTDPDNQKDIIRTYMWTYTYYLYDKFDEKKVPFSGRKYSNMRLYNIYRYTIHSDGTITDLHPIVKENDEFDEHVKNLILNNPPAKFIEGLPDKIKVELAVVQTASEEGLGGTGYMWGDYYNIRFEKGHFNSEEDHF